MLSSHSFLPCCCSLIILAFANMIGGGCCANALTLAEARQEVNEILSCVLQRAGMDTIMLKLLGGTSGIQAGPADPTLNKFLELEPDVVSGRLQNAVIDCFSDGNDNRQCCRNKGVPNECIYLCGGDEKYAGVAKPEKDMKQQGRSPSLLENCEDSNLEIFQCHFEHRNTSNPKKLIGKLIGMEKMKRDKILQIMQGGSNSTAGNGLVMLSDSEGCTNTNVACATAGIGCASIGMFGPIGGIFGGACGIVTGVGCLAAALVQECF